MGMKPKSGHSFFKVMPPDFAHHLRLPPLFVQKYEEILPENVKLRTSSGETWNVRLEQVEEKTYCFSGGWTKFAVDVGLKIGEFMVFWFNIGKSTFDVSLYGYSCCERQISRRGSPVDVSDSDEDVKLINFTEEKNNQSRDFALGQKAGNDGTQENDYTSEEEEANPQWKLRLRKDQRSRVLVYKEFAEAAGLRRKKTVMLRCPPKRRRWPVKLIYYKNYSWFRLDMGKGWGEFRIENGLVFGKTYLLEYIRDEKLIDVKLLERPN